jgi:hypothetical protein
MQRMRNKRRRLLSWVAALAVLSNVLAGALCHGPAQAAGSIDDILGVHLICTSDGAQTQVPEGGQDTDGKSKHCDACRLLAAFALIVVALAFAVIAFPSALVSRPPKFDLHTLAEHLSLGGIRSRAPPVSA